MKKKPFLKKIKIKYIKYKYFHKLKKKKRIKKYNNLLKKPCFYIKNNFSIYICYNMYLVNFSKLYNILCLDNYKVFLKHK